MIRSFRRCSELHKHLSTLKHPLCGLSPCTTVLSAKVHTSWRRQIPTNLRAKHSSGNGSQNHQHHEGSGYTGARWFSVGSVAAAAAAGGVFLGVWLSQKRPTVGDDSSFRPESLIQLGLPKVGVLNGAVAEQPSEAKRSNTDVVEETHKSNEAVQIKSRVPSKTMEEKIGACRKLLLQVKEETGSPGLVVCVSVDGETVMEEGLGYADLENDLPCHAHSVMRIASISKSMTAAIVGQLVEEGKLDLDLPVQHYVPEFPDKMWNGKPVKITSRHLLCHQSGIRHYDVKDKTGHLPIDLETDERFLKKYYDSVVKSLDVFKESDLKYEPGTKFNYTTFGYTLLSAVAEKAADKSFPILVSKLVNDLGLKHTTIDCNKRIIYNRTRFYTRSRSGCLVNAPYVDNSSKWAGGGILSSAPDVAAFANAMLYSLQRDPDDPQSLPGLLKRETVLELVTPRRQPLETKNLDSDYGYGWFVVPEIHRIGCGKRTDFSFGHTGAAVGASSIVLVVPSKASNGNLGNAFEENGKSITVSDGRPRGIVVTLFVNLTNVNLSKTAAKIAKVFQEPK